MGKIKYSTNCCQPSLKVFKTAPIAAPYLGPCFRHGPAEPGDNSITVGVRATDGLFGQPKTKTTEMKENCFHF